ncbi:AAA family ATPase [Tolypothrix sp. FACHB-123]|uniref:AAA family ATPase n=1 Tax=Tolypothrix sp. FACHB-123 TaxID=2692868 RepID=UPI001682EB72|nr:AAA family ATPase [Tolypothrix sp. FACHB-123]MBD2357519.1 AAA family ATPase [Tolypothrix sp. FACHB-123]
MTTETYTPIIPGYQICSQLYAGTRTKVYRAIRELDKVPVVIKMLAVEYPSFHELLQFRNQYTISKHLHIPGIIQPLSLETYGNGYILIMADTREISLREYIQDNTISLIEFCQIALQLTDILHDLHHNRVIHKDIKPANILIHPQTKQIQLIDFSIASLLPKETTEIQNPHVLEGTLAYISPEQTGRMNRGIDYRSDFYALGVTFYELLTGELPFIARDPLELVHCHLAKQPNPINNEAIPQVVGDIVMKLLAKNAEDRYQSALGLKHDLEICLTQLKDTGEITNFAIAQRDICDRFLIPEKLYGRKLEVSTLLQAFERVANGTSEMMLVAGFSGIGKTSVVNEVHKPITRQQGYFIKGKFDQFNRNIPLSAFVQALRDLIGQLLSESDAQLQIWKTKFLAVVGENGQVLIDVIPELEIIIGKQPPAPELSGKASENRFNLLFQNFIAVFTKKEHPLVMFLDDLQWADLASLQLIQLLMQDNGHLLLLGAYRDNEVSPAHPLMLTVDELQQAGTTINTITLLPLAFSDTNLLIADTLQCTTERSHPLAELIARKTQGNPFFITQFLKALHEDGQITFNHHQGYWECDITQINALSLTDDVVEFMAQQLQKLPSQTQNVLKLAACIGNSFDLTTLAIVSQQSPTHTATDLWKALQEGLILPASQNYKFFQGEIAQSAVTAQSVSLTYRFLHDRVQQAAYKLIAEADKQATHLAIGELLLSNTPAEQLNAYIFEIVNHLNTGINLITQPQKKLELARLNLIAGCKAKTAIAYDAAVKYFSQGIDLLPADAWQQQYQLTLNLHHERLEAACLHTDFDKLATWGDMILQSATSLLDTIKVHETRMTAFRSQAQFANVVEIGLQVLKLLGVEFPAQPTVADIGAAAEQTRQLWQERTALSLLDLPAMSDPHQLAAMQIMSKLVSSVYIAVPPLLPLLIFKQVEMSIQYGNCAIAIFSYADYGLILCGVLGDIDAGYEFGQLALKLLDKLQTTAFKSRAYFVVNSFIRHWKEPLHQTLPSLLAGYQSGLETGDWECVGLNLLTYSQYCYWSSRELTDLAQQIEAHRQFINQIKQQPTINAQLVYQQAILNLMGQAEVPYLLQGKVLNATQILPALQGASDWTGLLYIYLHQAILCYLFGEEEQAAQQIAIAENYSNSIVGYFMVAIQVFYDALIHLARYGDVGDAEKLALIERINTHQDKLQGWATYAPFNHQHRWELVTAERYRVQRQHAEAMEYYDLAIANAKTNGYLQEEALSNELAAKFYLDWGKEKVAAGYMQEAYYCYAHWGAKAKTNDLENRYPHLLRPIFQQTAQTLNPLETLASMVGVTVSNRTSTHSDRSSSTNLNTVLDFAAILKASQSLSGAIQLDELLQKLTQIILQNSGGDRCALILPNSHGTWEVKAIATPETTQLCSQPLEGNPHLPVKLIQYVKNTQELVLIDELKTDLAIIDAYLEQHQPKSVLCLPILNQGHLIGILYLKNRSASRVFTSDRILILNFLCTQAAISLENARLYQKSQIYAQQLEQSLEILQTTQKQLLQEEQTLQQQALALLQLSQSQAITQGKLSTAFPELTQVTAQTLQTERVSVWLFDEHHTKIHCLDLFQRSSQEHSQGFELQVADYPAYFCAIKSQPIIAVDDALSDPRTCEFSHGYLDVLHIASMLDCGVQVDGAIGGVICCEHVGEKRSWTPAEQNFISSIANLIALTLESHQRQQKAQQLKQALLDLKQSQLQIVQNEKMASLGNLVAGVAHEVNNPIGFLNGSISNTQDYIQDILAHLELYQQQYPQATAPILDHAENIDLEFLIADLPKLLEAMKGATNRIKSISTSLRTFSRADTDCKVLANVHEGLESTLLILKYRLKANEHRPAIIIHQQYGVIPAIECFPGQLNQVFMNILANAIDMFDEMAQSLTLQEMQAHPQQITISTEAIANQVYIKIRDNGKGMSPQVQEKIFDHLFTTKGVGKGTGLGLAIARQIVTEKHGGTIEVNSVLGQGTEFAIAIPITI